MKASPKHAPREEFSRIHNDHRLLKNRAQFAVARAKNSRRGVPRSGGLGDEIPHKKPNYAVSNKVCESVHQIVPVIPY